jgi:hypothetical protein
MENVNFDDNAKFEKNHNTILWQYLPQNPLH